MDCIGNNHNCWLDYLLKKKKGGSITLSNEQAQQVLQLARKEREELAQKMDDMVDKDAIQGKTVSVDNLCKETAEMSDDVKKEIVRYKQELIEKYGPTIPVNTAHRISWELEGNGKMWSDYPGCFERHLQRRDGNPLFPPERRIVTKKEIDEAKAKDLIEYNQFAEKVKSFSTSLQGMGKAPPAQASSLLKDIMDLLEEAGSIGGSVQSFVQTLESVEEDLMQSLNQAVPNGVDVLKSMYSLSVAARDPYSKQSTRKDSPIREGVKKYRPCFPKIWPPSQFEGYRSRAFAPDYRPNEADIRNHLDIAIKQGFSKERAAEDPCRLE